MSRAWMKARSEALIVSRTSRVSMRSASARVSNRSCRDPPPLWKPDAMGPPGSGSEDTNPVLTAPG